MEIAKVVIIGIVLVFLILVLLTLVLVLFKKALGREKKQYKANKGAQSISVSDSKAASEVNDTQENKDDALSLICVITAAVAAYRDENGSAGNFRVVSFRKTPRIESHVK